MNLGDRTILWLGPQPFLIGVHAGPLPPRIHRVLAGPPPPAAGGPAGWEYLRPWLAEHCAAGSTLDVVHQDHLLRVETFPKMGSGDLDGAMKARLTRDLLMPVKDLESHTARIDTPGATQGVFAAIPDAVHLSVSRTLASAHLKAGRVGFAGQLAVRVVQTRTPDGAWTILPATAACRSLLVARGTEGAVLALTSNEPPELAASQAQARLGLFMPKCQPEPGARELEKLVKPIPHPAASSATVLPGALHPLLSVFLNDAGWRLASQDDRDYPYHFASSTWAFAVVLILMLLYTGYLWRQVSDYHAAASEIARMQRETTALAKQERDLGGRLKDLELIEKQIRGVGAEVFDNARWLQFLGGLRDRVAPALVFDSVSVGAPQLVLTGSQGGVDAFLGLYEALVQALDDESVRFQRFDHEKGGRSRFSIQIDRRTSNPPRPLPGKV